MSEKESEKSEEESSEKKEIPLPTKQDAQTFGKKTFVQLGVSPWLVRNLNGVGISKPTLI